MQGCEKRFLWGVIIFKVLSPLIMNALRFLPVLQPVTRGSHFCGDLCSRWLSLRPWFLQFMVWTTSHLIRWKRRGVWPPLQSVTMESSWHQIINFLKLQGIHYFFLFHWYSLSKLVVVKVSVGVIRSFFPVSRSWKWKSTESEAKVTELIDNYSV